ncbi:helix-turn-helix domain-containing protein [Cloacibacterium sp.]|uniref:helix-turn-helix domain-containing protein n=1 Tax=Cloacibacterium sp. TaxID=1913682 RepID=UPI0039E72657
MTRQEVANLFGVTLPTIHDWSRKKILNPYRIGKKIRYKESEVKEALKQIR